LYTGTDELISMVESDGVMRQMQSRTKVFKLVGSELEEQPPKMNGSFEIDGSYVVVRTDTDPNTNEKKNHIFSWSGHGTKQEAKNFVLAMANNMKEQFPTAEPPKAQFQGLETKDFLQCFLHSAVRYIGAYDRSKSRLLRVKGRERKNIRVVPGRVSFLGLNSGECFVLDAGAQIWQWIGKESTPGNRSKANEILRSFVNERNGKVKTEIVDQDMEPQVFWEALGGRGAVGKAVNDDYVDEEELQKYRRLYRLTPGDDGKMVFTLLATGSAVTPTILKTTDCFLYDAGVDFFLWIGRKAPTEAKKSGMDYAARHAQISDRIHIPIIKILEGTESDYFKVAFGF